MISPLLISRLEDKVLETYEKAQHIYGRNFAVPNIVVKDIGTKGGTASYLTQTLTFSETLYKENVEHFLASTVPHEVAHLITRAMYPRCTPHGWEWKSVMRALGVEPNRCHSYNVASVARGVRYVYSCNCDKEFLIGRAVHQKIQGGQKRYCRKCKTLSYTGKVETPA